MNTSTIIEPQLSKIAGFLRDILNVIVICAAIILAWFMIMTLTMVMFEPTDTAIVLVNDHSIIERLPADLSFTASSDRTITVRSEMPGFVTGIYLAGGIMVLPALRNGCIDLRPS